MDANIRRRFLLLAATSLGLAPSVPSWALGFGGGAREAFGARFAPAARAGDRRRVREGRSRAIDSLLEWNEVALEATGIDHTPVAAGDTRTFGEQLGPGRSSRALAIVHIAIFDAMNAIERRYRGYADLAATPQSTRWMQPSRKRAMTRWRRCFLAARCLRRCAAQDLAGVRDLSARARHRTRCECGGSDPGRANTVQPLNFRWD
jgi:hypothetical protein